MTWDNISCSEEVCGEQVTIGHYGLGDYEDIYADYEIIATCCECNRAKEGIPSREEEEEQTFHSYEGGYFAAADSQLGQALVALQDSRLSDSIHIGSNSKVTDYLEKNVRDIVAATLARKAAK